MSERWFQFNRVMTFVLRVFLGAFYAVAGAVKIPDPAKFAEAVSNFRILPHAMINGVAITLPGVELVAGVLLVFGVWRRASAWVINLLTIVFIVAITAAFARGLNIDCGCFGTVGGREVGFKAIAEDVGLLLCGLWVLRNPKPEIRREPDVEPGITIPTA